MSDFIDTHRRLAIHLGIPSEPLHSRIAEQALERIKELEAENSRYRVSKENLARLLRSPVVSHAEIQACFEGG